jgi:hypothetical protein
MFKEDSPEAPFSKNIQLRWVTPVIHALFQARFKTTSVIGEMFGHNRLRF